jgi:hypothetical protein
VKLEYFHHELAVPELHDFELFIFSLINWGCDVAQHSNAQSLLLEPGNVPWFRIRTGSIARQANSDQSATQTTG